MGLVTTRGEASTGIADALQWNDRVGPLSGKTLITVIVFALAWAGLTALAPRQPAAPHDHHHQRRADRARTRRHLSYLLPSLRV